MNTGKSLFIFLLSVGLMCFTYFHILDSLHTIILANQPRDVNILNRNQTVQHPSSIGLSSDQLQTLSFTTRMTHYPRNGTGVSVDVSKDFDPTLFNSFCTRNRNLKAVLPIYSSGDRFKSRDLLRNSLGKLAKKLNCKIFFIIGVSTNQTVQTMVKEEYTRERDIMMVGKLDTYRDLNNKAFAMIEWVSKYCLQVPYVIHLIDDTYIDFAWFLKRLAEIKEEFYMLAPEANTPAVRDHPKSFVTVEEYPFPRFPPYAYGWVFAFPTRVAARLMTTVYSATYCWIEDVWIGGHVRISAGVKLIPVPKEAWVVSYNPKKYSKPIPSVRVIHGVDHELLYRFYNSSL